MLKVMTLVGTRPEIIKLSRVLAALDRHTEHILVHSGQNYDYELNEVFFHDLEIRKPDYFLEVAGNTACETIANVLVKTEQVILKEKPDAFLIYGDTNSCIGAIAAKRYKVPVFHMEAGNRCFDERVPEEINRRLVDHLSDINMSLTEHARSYLIREGIRPETIIKTGSTLHEVLDYYKEGIENSDVVARLDLTDKNYFVVSAHREENVDVPEQLHKLINSIDAIVEKFDKDVVFSVHPRTRKRLESLSLLPKSPRVQMLKPLGFFDYIQLQKQAFCVLSDSGTITEEAALLGFPAVTMRQAHERPEGMDAGILTMTGLSAENIVQAIEFVTTEMQKSAAVQDYLAGAVSRKVLNIILSYTPYIKHTVWREY